jgi:hyperosmotically inducible protein
MKTTQTTHRPDADIFAAVRSALDRNPAVPAAVRVHVKDGMVTLTGSVRTPADRMEAEETTRAVDGVSGLVNDIFVVNVPAEGFEPPEI